MLHVFTCKITGPLLWELCFMACVINTHGRLATVYMLVFLLFWWLFALGFLWTNLDFCKSCDILPQSVPWPHGPKGPCPHFKEGTHGQHEMITEKTEWERVIVAATSVTHGVNGLSHQCSASCGHAGCTAASSLCIANVSYTCNYPASKLKYLHRQQLFISRRARFVSCDSSTALLNVIKWWWFAKGQVTKSWRNPVSKTRPL